MPAVSGPPERAQRRTVQQIVDPVPSLPTLDDPAPQMVEQLPDILLFFDALSPVPEQAIEVPRYCPWASLCELRFASRSWWNSWFKSRRSYPSPRCSGLWSRTSTIQLLAVELVEVFLVFSPRTELLSDCRAGGLQDFRPGQSSSSSSHVPAHAYDALDAPCDGGFSHFPKIKKREVGSALGVGTAPRVEPIHAASLCRAHGSRGG